MINLVQTQADLVSLLLSATALNPVNIASYRKMRLQGELNLALVWQTPRGGTSGLGVLVEMPFAKQPRPNVYPAVLDWYFPIVTVENPTINFAAGAGTFIDCEVAAQSVIDTVGVWSMDQLGTFEVSDPMTPDERFQGCVAYRTNFKIAGRPGAFGQSLPRCNQTIISISGGVATITCSTPGSNIRYTLDGTSPAMAGSPTAQDYTGPVTVQSGDVIRAGAYLAGYQPGYWTYAVAP